ncbi:uncharacterized protein LOC120849855 [Ixodes scapularis]|uniref:uncharacterized protein LOC120849855 n=1 Tax=Ixodes scapularis TaxID=6945 RepID=UPI001A9FBFB8|nr:uncharacterized protein LOC120849855 [Ixodes scapularis]
MEVVVEGEVIAPEDLNADWIPVHTARKKARQPKVPSPKPSNPAERLASRSSPRPGSKPRPPQLPRLPDDDYKIVIRPRGGLNLSSMSTGKLQDLIFNTAQTNYDAARADQIRINATQNSILISTPSEERARTYFNLHTLRIGEENYPPATYVADPANTSRGIIFDVPEYDTPDNISRYLIDYNHDPAILLARRMGKTNSVLIVFDSPEVPHWVSYHGAPYRCVLFKHKTEACNICWKIGHRADVCPSPRANKCPRCGIDNPPTDHDCEVKCAVCRGPHPTGSPRCKKRFQEHPAIRRRQAQRPVGDFGKSSTPPPPRGRSRERKSVPSEPGFRSRSRTHSRPRPRSRSRSKPRQVPQDEPPRQPAATKQVSWANVASGSTGGDARDNELAALRREVQTLTKLITAVQKENTELRTLIKQKEVTPPAPTPVPLPQPVAVAIPSPDSAAQPTKRRAIDTNDVQIVDELRRLSESMTEMSRTFSARLQTLELNVHSRFTAIEGIVSKRSSELAQLTGQMDQLTNLSSQAGSSNPLPPPLSTPYLQQCIPEYGFTSPPPATPQ